MASESLTKYKKGVLVVAVLLVSFLLFVLIQLCLLKTVLPDFLWALFLIPQSPIFPARILSLS